MRRNSPGFRRSSASAATSGPNADARRSQALQLHAVSSLSLLILAALLILPGLAGMRLAGMVPGYILPAVMGGLSFWTYLRLAYDKKMAQTNQWRVPEASLHLYELLGGWPGSFFAQRQFRHKISKRSYQVTFWVIVLAYQAVSFDYLNDWKYSRSIAERVSEYKKGM